MSTILITWELGAGLGHATRLLPVAEMLRQRGHRVIVALRDLAGTAALFTQRGISCLPAPFRLGLPANHIQPAVSFAHILHNTGFANETELGALVATWQSIFDLVDPDMIVFDHSPTALLAARGQRASRYIFGDGFCCPPDGDQMPLLRPASADDRRRAAWDERQTLAVANAVLAARGMSAMERLCDLYRDVEGQVLTTFAELDHFTGRQGASYVGPCTARLGGKPSWPTSGVRRAVAYVRPFEGIRSLFASLHAQRVATLIYCPGLTAQDTPRSPYIRFVSEPVDLEAAADSFDFAILNATHGTTATMLLHGKPILQVPIHLEQQLVARRTCELGAGLAGHHARPGQMAGQMAKMIASTAYADAAQSFAARYRAYNRQRQLDAVVARLEHALGVAA